VLTVKGHHVTCLDQDTYYDYPIAWRP
jgi:hypothetical protein